MKTHYEYIMFREIPRKKKEKRVTSLWHCYTRIKEGDATGTVMELLGLIKWYAPWRRYCYLPPSNGLKVILSDDCLEDIQHFIRQLMEMRK